MAQIAFIGQNFEFALINIFKKFFYLLPLYDAIHLHHVAFTRVTRQYKKISNINSSRPFPIKLKWCLPWDEGWRHMTNLLLLSVYKIFLRHADVITPTRTVWLLHHHLNYWKCVAFKFSVNDMSRHKPPGLTNTSRNVYTSILK